MFCTLPPVTAGHPSGVVSFLMTDVEDSTSSWESDPTGPLARSDAALGIVESAHTRLVSVHGPPSVPDQSG